MNEKRGTKRPLTRNAKTVRMVQRGVHLGGSLVLVLYLYTPLSENEVFAIMLRAMVFPVVTASGLLMWQWPRARRALRAGTTRKQ